MKAKATQIVGDIESVTMCLSPVGDGNANYKLKLSNGDDDLMYLIPWVSVCELVTGVLRSGSAELRREATAAMTQPRRTVGVIGLPSLPGACHPSGSDQPSAGSESPSPGAVSCSGL